MDFNTPQYPQMPPTYNPNNQQTQQMAMILHLSQYAGWVIPVAGLIVPILIWQLKKNELPGLDEHGKNVTNWILSEFIYGFVCGLLCMVLIGFPLLAVLALMGLIFPAIGGIKANSGEVWKYPLAIPFFK